MDTKENVIEWQNGDKIAYCTFNQKRFINRIKNMAKKDGTPVEIIAENADGSVLAKIPLNAIHLYLMAWNNSGFPSFEEEKEET